jgi:hypothetical protein
MADDRRRAFGPGENCLENGGGSVNTAILLAAEAPTGQEPNEFSNEPATQAGAFDDAESTGSGDISAARRKQGVTQ